MKILYIFLLLVCTPPSLKGESLEQIYPAQAMQQTEQGIEPAVHLTMEATAIRLNSTAPGPDDYTRQKLKSIVQKAIDLLPVHIPAAAHSMTGFYRKLSTEGSRYTHLIEAAVLVQDVGYQSAIAEGSTKVKLLQLRQATDTGLVDSAAIRAAREGAKGNYRPASRNAIYRTLQYNLARAYNSPYTLLNKDGRFAEASILKMEQVSLAGEDTIYHIAFKDAFSLDGGGYIKINAADFAILEFQRSVYVQGELMDRTLVKYRKIDGRYFPALIKVEVPRKINKDYGEHQMDIHTLWIDTVETAGFDAIKAREAVPWMQELHTIRLPYDPAFWKSYRLLHMYPLEKDAQESLEKTSVLERQFMQHALKARGNRYQ